MGVSQLGEGVGVALMVAEVEGAPSEAGAEQSLCCKCISSLHYMLAERLKPTDISSKVSSFMTRFSVESCHLVL